MWYVFVALLSVIWKTSLRKSSKIKWGRTKKVIREIPGIHNQEQENRKGKGGKKKGSVQGGNDFALKDDLNL